MPPARSTTTRFCFTAPPTPPVQGYSATSPGRGRGVQPTMEHGVSATRAHVPAARKETQTRDAWDLEHLLRTTGVDRSPFSPEEKRTVATALERAVASRSTPTGRRSCRTWSRCTTSSTGDPTSGRESASWWSIARPGTRREPIHRRGAGPSPPNGEDRHHDGRRSGVGSGSRSRARRRPISPGFRLGTARPSSKRFTDSRPTSRLSRTGLRRVTRLGVTGAYRGAIDGSNWLSPTAGGDQGASAPPACSRVHSRDASSSGTRKRRSRPRPAGRLR